MIEDFSDKNLNLKVIKKINNTYTNNWFFPLIDDKLKNDREFVLEVIKGNADMFRYISDDLKNDREFVLEAVKINPLVFKYLSNDLKNDREIILKFKETINLKDLIDKLD